MSDTFRPDVLRLCALIVSAHVSHTRTPPEDVPQVIHSVYAALNSAGSPTAGARPEPAVPVKKSIFPDHIVCLEDGKKLKMLKRHLQVTYGLTPQAYREKWGLPTSYPMTAPNYAARRSALAKATGLGRKVDAPPQTPPAPPIQRFPQRAHGKKAPRKPTTT